LAYGIIVVVFVLPFQFLNQLTNSEPCVKIPLEDNTTPLSSNFLQLTTWWTRELMGWDWHQCHLMGVGMCFGIRSLKTMQVLWRSYFCRMRI